MSTLRKIVTLLTPKQRARAGVLALMMLVGSLLEAASLGLIVPLLAIIADGAASQPRLGPLLSWLGQPSQAKLMVGSALILFGLYFIRTLFLAFLVIRQNAFVFGVRAELSHVLFTEYLRQPWSFHLQRNSAQMINVLTNETNVFTASALQPAMILLAEGLILLGVSILLFAAEPLGASAAMVLLVAVTWTLQRITGKRLSQWGKARQYHEGLRVQHVQQGLGGAKDVKLLGREQDFIAQYDVHNGGSTRVVERQNTLQQLPKLAIEVVAVGGLTMLVLLMVAQGKPPSTVVATLGLFAVAAFRLMPSATRVVASLQSLRYARPVVDALHREFALLADAKAPQSSNAQLSFERAITLEGIGYHYPGSSTPALSNINLTIGRGESVGFIGGSGAGKSTLVDIILGLLTPTTGRAAVDGADIQTRLRGWQDQIGYVPQTIFLTDDTLRRNVAFGLPEANIDDDAVRRAIRGAHLEEFVDGLPEGLQTRVGERGVRLSGGQRQRIGIARALYHDPQVIVLDEATSALDTATEEGVMTAVNGLAGQKTLIIVAHRLTTVAHCDRLYRLERGRIVAQGTFEITTGGYVAPATHAGSVAG